MMAAARDAFLVAGVLSISVTLFYRRRRRLVREKCRPRIFAVHHAESVAAMRERESCEAYCRVSWVDDDEADAARRLRDCQLSPAGIKATLAAADAVAGEDELVGRVLLVVSPLLRTILTACLLYHKHASKVRRTSP